MLSRLMTRKEQMVLLAVAGAIVIGALVLSAHQRNEVPPEAAASTPSKAEGPAPPLEILEPTPAAALVPFPAPKAPEPPPTVTVSVTGAVRKEGVYTLDAGARVQDVLDKAGGVREDALLTDVNRAAKLIDGTTLSIPVRPVRDPYTGRYVYSQPEAAFVYNPPQYTISGWQSIQAASPPVSGSSAPGASAAAGAPAGLINLNTASQEQLETLPGIGPKLAQSIIEYRTAARFRSVDDLANVRGIGEKRLEQMRPLVTVE